MYELSVLMLGMFSVVWPSLGLHGKECERCENGE